MADEKLGVENLKKAVKFSIELGQQFEKSGKDGWSWTDSFDFVDEAMALPGIAKAGSSIAAELKDLSNEERDELNAYVAEEFDLENDKVEGIVEDSLNIAFSIVSLVQKFR